MALHTANQPVFIWSGWDQVIDYFYRYVKDLCGFHAYFHEVYFHGGVVVTCFIVG